MSELRPTLFFSVKGKLSCISTSSVLNINPSCNVISTVQQKSENLKRYKNLAVRCFFEEKVMDRYIILSD